MRTLSRDTLIADVAVAGPVVTHMGLGPLAGVRTCTGVVTSVFSSDLAEKIFYAC